MDPKALAEAEKAVGAHNARVARFKVNAAKFLTAPLFRGDGVLKHEGKKNAGYAADAEQMHREDWALRREKANAVEGTAFAPHNVGSQAGVPVNFAQAHIAQVHREIEGLASSFARLPRMHGFHHIAADAIDRARTSITEARRRERSPDAGDKARQAVGDALGVFVAPSYLRNLRTAVGHLHHARRFADAGDKHLVAAGILDRSHLRPDKPADKSAGAHWAVGLQTKAPSRGSGFLLKDSVLVNQAHAAASTVTSSTPSSAPVAPASAAPVAMPDADEVLSPDAERATKLHPAGMGAKK